MKYSIFRLIPSAAAFLVLAFSTAFAGPRVVNCDEGDSLEDAILSGQGSAKELEITLMGTCYESFTISRDRVVITGDGNSTIYGQVRIIDAGPVEFSNVTISGEGHGVDLVNGRVRLIATQLVGNERFGIRARYGSVVTIRDGTVTGNEGAFGIYGEDATLQLFRTEITGNAETGIGIQDNSRLRMNLGGVTDHVNGSGVTAVMGSALLFENTTIARNADTGVYIDAASSARIDDSEVTDNSRQGVQVQGNSTLIFAGSTAARNGENGIFVYSHAIAEIHDATIRENYGNGILAAADSGVFLRGTTFLKLNSNWDLFCDGEESSAEIAVEWPGEIGSLECSGF